MLAERFKYKDPRQQGKAKRLGFKGSFSSVVFKLFGDSHGLPGYVTGLSKMKLGQWDDAQRHFWAALDAPPHSPGRPAVNRMVCMKLAWLEDDPEKAVRFLEISCQPGAGVQNGNHDIREEAMRNAISLCRTTGSTALRDHYKARLDAHLLSKR